MEHTRLDRSTRVLMQPRSHYVPRARNMKSWWPRDAFVTGALREGGTTMKLFDIAVGVIMGGVLGFVMAQFFDLLPAIIIGVIMGGSIAFGYSAMSTKKEHCDD